MPPRRRPHKGGDWLGEFYLIMGLIGLVYSFLLPLFKLLHYALMGAAMWFGGTLMRKLIRKVFSKEENSSNKTEAEKESSDDTAGQIDRQSTTGDTQVDELLLRGQQLLYQIREENERLPDPVISAQIDEIESVSNQIFRIVIEQPEKADQIRRFMEYYLPTTLKMLSAYRRMDENNATGEQARKTQQRIRQSLDTVIAAFRKQLNQLFEEEAIDIATDIDVMETMLRQDGLIDSGLKVKTSTGEEKQ